MKGINKNSDKILFTVAHNEIVFLLFTFPVGIGFLFLAYEIWNPTNKMIQMAILLGYIFGMLSIFMMIYFLSIKVSKKYPRMIFYEDYLSTSSNKKIKYTDINLIELVRTIHSKGENRCIKFYYNSTCLTYFELFINTDYEEIKSKLNTLIPNHSFNYKSTIKNYTIFPDESFK